MTETAQCETPMSDHIEDFWKLLATEHVRIIIDIRRDHDEGQTPHWDSTSFPDDVAKALVAQRGPAGLLAEFKKSAASVNLLCGPRPSGKSKDWLDGQDRGLRQGLHIAETIIAALLSPL